MGIMVENSIIKSMDSIPLILIFIPIIFAMIIYLFKSKFWNYSVFIAQGIISFLLVRYIFFIGEEKVHRVLVGGWKRDVGIAFKNDSLSVGFMVLGVFIWWAVIVYSWNKRSRDDKFWFFLLFLQGTFLGLIQTNDLFNLFIFLEAITIISTILITYKKDGYSVRSGLYYILFNSSGMIFFLLGLIIIYTTMGTLNLESVKNLVESHEWGYKLKLAYIFFSVAFGVKSAFFPVFNWLPKAHGAAPSAVSALLSGVLVKTGVYGFIRLNQSFHMDIFKDVFFLVGFITALSGVIFAISQKDIKQILAFHTISQIGIILMGISSIKGAGYQGGLLHIFNHGVFKSILFLGSGVIINRYKTRHVAEIGGVFKNIPVVSIGLIVAVLSITGAPGLNGNLSKALIKSSFKGDFLKIVALQIVNIGTMISMIKFSGIFFRSSGIPQKSRWVNKKKFLQKGNFKKFRYLFKVQYIPIILLAFVCIYLGNPNNLFIKKILGFNFAYINRWNFLSLLKYLASGMVAYIIYKYTVYKEIKILKKIRHSNLSFEHANAMLVVFVFLLVVLSFTGDGS